MPPKRLTAAQSPNQQFNPTHSMPKQRLFSILRASWIITTTSRKKWTDDFLVKQNASQPQTNDNSFHKINCLYWDNVE